MTWTLRPYQARAVDKAVHFLRGTRPSIGTGGLIVFPTGAGKAHLIAAIAAEMGKPMLIFQPSKEILEQNAAKLMAVGVEPRIYSASMKSRDVGPITLATIGSVHRRPDLFAHFPYVIVDEAHGIDPKQGRYREFLKLLGDIRLLGLTATPYRLTTDGYGGSMQKFLTRTRPRVLTDVVDFVQTADLIAQGFLVQPTYQIVSGFKASEVPVNSTGADFDDDGVKRYFNRTNFHARVKRVVERLLAIGRTRILVFTRFVEDAERLASEVPNVSVVSADTPAADRALLITGFRNGEIPVMATVGVLAQGFDYPQLDTVVLARPTMSLTVYYQQAGRLMRPWPGKDPWIIDMVDQVGAFGRVEHLRLRAAGFQGEQWEVISQPPDGPVRVLTNAYFNGPPKGQSRRFAFKAS